MPHRSVPVALPDGPRALYDRIVAANGGRASGYFDVLAWRGGHTVFVEYRGPGDRRNSNERAWIAAALAAGVSEHDMLVVVAA
jgi:hypothetical protein